MSERAHLSAPVRRRPFVAAAVVTAALAAFAAVGLGARADVDLGAEMNGGKDLFGWAERVVIGPGGGIELEAKLDTGADTSSLGATHIRRIRRGEKRLVRFELQHPDTGETLTVERPLVRRATIKRHDGDHQRRSVVTIDVCLGDHLLRGIEVTLIDRSEFVYPLLLGRSALEGIAVVDPELTFTQSPDCELGSKE